VAKIKIKSFEEIDFLTVNPAEDEFVLPGGDHFRFSDSMCDYCWTAGTVLESIKKSPDYFCIMCKNNLKPVFFRNDFLQPMGEEIRFLLPGHWSTEEKNNWYQAFKKRRIEQEVFLDHILKQGKE
jgi:hypothetical protein